MPKMNASTATVLTILMFVLPSFAQNKAPDPDSKSAPKTKDAPQLVKEHFYYHSWGKNEIKVCETYSAAPDVLICDSADDALWSGSFMNLIGDNGRAGKTEDQSYREALGFASAHGKTFPATFSEEPWPMPQKGYKMSVWNCTKDKAAISCDLGSRGSRPATGE